MSATPILSTEQLHEFAQRGILRLDGLFSADRVRRALEHVQVRLARLGLWKNGAWSLGAHPKPQWPATGLKSSKVIGNKHSDVEALLEEPALLSVVKVLLAGGAVDRTMSPRAQILFTLPNAETWAVPTGWHVDNPRLVSGRQPGVQLFVFLDTVASRGGGTLVIAGSHRLLNDGRFIRSGQIRGLLRQEPFFRELYSGSPVSCDVRADLLGHSVVVRDVTLELVELTGAPGDAYITDLRVLHSAAPNTLAHPRIMLTHRFVRADVVQELTAGFGWQRA
jgi:ectoine hydroxylase-related dioxygenase (phytanoyl-CoA dioxygenase family)